MGAAVRVLLCAEEDWSDPTMERLGASGIELGGRASSGGDALAQHRRGENDALIIVGDLDGCHGSRIAKVLNRTRSVPTLIVCTEAHHAEAQRAANEQRGSNIHVLPLASFRPEIVAERLRPPVVAPPLAPEETPWVPSPSNFAVAAVGREHFDAVVLIGSAGTPNLLPRLLKRTRHREAPLVVAVHHNPRWSEAFSGWIEQLTGQPVMPWTAGSLAPRATYVVRSEGDGETLRPDLGGVVKSLVGGGRRVLALLASGMGMCDVESLTRLRDAGGLIVGLRPVLCPQPAMVHSAISADLLEASGSIEELGWLVAHARLLRRVTPVVG